MANEQAPTGFYLPNDLVSVILARLPAKSLAQCRTVSQDLRRLASDNYVLLEHNRCQPSEPLITTFLPGGGALHHGVGALDLRTYTTRRVLGWVLWVPSAGYGEDVYDAPRVHASCEGLLLVSFRHILYVGNPTTRQWTVLPPIHQDPSCGLMGLYRHVASGEYRVLYFHQVDGLEPTYHALTMDFPEQAAVNIEPPPPPGNDLLTGTTHASIVPSILVSRSLYWPPVGENLAEANMLAFHTGTQLFRWIRPPPHIREGLCEYTPLFEMDGKVALLNFFRDESGSVVELWLMPDENQPWVLRGRYVLPIPNDVYFGWEVHVYQDGDILVSRGPEHYVFHLHKNWMNRRTFELVADNWSITSYTLKESPALHDFLQALE